MIRYVRFQTGVNIVGLPTYTVHLVSETKNNFGKSAIKTKSFEYTN